MMLNKMFCVQCHRFLGEEDLRVGTVKLKCPNCKSWNTFVSRVTTDPFTVREPREEGLTTGPLGGDNGDESKN